MAGRVLLDTNVVIAFFGAEKAVTARVTQTDFVLSSTVLGELYYGARKSGRAAINLSRIDELAASAVVLACDEVTAQYYGKIKDGLRLKPCHPRERHLDRSRCDAVRLAGGHAGRPEPEVIAAEIAEDLQAALDQFSQIAADLKP